MGNVSITLPTDGSTASVSQYNTPITSIVTAINGNLDSTNISSLSGTKITAGTIPGSALNTAAAGGWNVLNQTFTYTGNNGNKEFTGTFPADVTDKLSAGMKLQLTRGTTAPSQSMAFVAASSQYASKTSPTGISFTAAFTCEAWVYLNSYTTGGIVSRFDNTNGIIMYTNASGQLQIQSGASGSVGAANTYQSIPLKRWVHVAATLTASTHTATMYINGTLVPSLSVGTNSQTVITQAGNLQVGAFNSGSYLDGYISEARVWSVAQSQANIQANMGISLTGSESNLVALFQGNGNFNDKTSNANNLTASGGAIATQAANPYNNIEYGIVTKVGAFSGGVTPVTLFTGTDCNIPNMTLTNAQYSTVKAPYGFNTDEGKWTTQLIIKTDIVTNSPTATTWYNTIVTPLNLPTGAWRLGYEGNFYTTKAATTVNNLYVTLSTSSSAETETLLTSAGQVEGATGQMTLCTTWSRYLNVNVTGQTPYYLLLKTNAVSVTSITVYGAFFAATVIEAKCAYI